MEEPENVQAFVREFDKNFYHLKEIPVLLYGVGVYTEMILRHVKGYSFAGLMDRNASGQTVYGLPVMPFEEAAERSRTIIIVASISVCPEIYRRICPFVAEHQMEVYYLNGLRPLEYDQSIMEKPYWQENTGGLYQRILASDVISFDVFDTLVMRRCLYPEVIFELLERRAGWEGFAAGGDAAAKRVRAEKECYRCVSRYYKLEDIYRVYQEKYEISGEDARRLMDWELELEAACLMPRKEMTELFDAAVRAGKTVILTTDMYLDKKQMQRLLNQCGIQGYHALYISCERKGSKYKGDLWEQVRADYPGRTVLHIGDNEQSDVQNAREHGIHAYGIKSGAGLFELAGLGKLTPEPASLEDKLMVGQFIAHGLHNPFAGHKFKGRLPVDRWYDFGYLFFGPLALHYMTWCFQLVMQRDMSHILFISRDGYLFDRIYRRLTSRFALSGIPEPVYFLTSRRASSVACIRSEEDIWFILDKMCGSASVLYEDLLKGSFGVRTDREDPYNGKTLYELGKRKVFRQVKERYQDRIIGHAAKERQGYEAYIGSLDLPEDGEIGLFNFISRGVTQKFVSRLLGRRVTGLYFAAETCLADILDEDETIFTLYKSRLSTHTAKQNLYSKYLFGEVVFTAPDGQLRSFDFAGKPVYEDRDRESFAHIKECQEGILQYVEDMIPTREALLGFQYNEQMVDALFGLLDQENFWLGASIKENFVFSDPYSAQKRVGLLSD